MKKNCVSFVKSYATKIRQESVNKPKAMLMNAKTEVRDLIMQYFLPFNQSFIPLNK